MIGHIVSVQGFRVKVELLPETRSAMRATPDGVQAAIAINAYLAFSLGAGETIIGIITDLEARETFDPLSGDELSLELVKPRRIANVQLLGTIGQGEDGPTFSPGITVLPTLDTPAEIGSPDVLRAVFEVPPRRNRPEGYNERDFDCDLPIGHPTGQVRNVVKASYNDLFSRPLAIVGNTGSGKSFSVTSLIQKAMAALGGAAQEPHIFIIDINGEYAKAFPGSVQTPRPARIGVSTTQPPAQIQASPDAQASPVQLVVVDLPAPPPPLPPLSPRPAPSASGLTDRIYLNGQEFGLPLWFFNAEEICAWLSAAEQTQEPVLKDWWAIAKGGNAEMAAGMGALQNAMSALDHFLSELASIKRKNGASHCDAIVGHLAGSGIDTSAFVALFVSHRSVDKYDANVMANAAQIADEGDRLLNAIRTKIVASTGAAEEAVRTADSPHFVARSTLTDPTLINRAVSKEDSYRIEAHLTTLKLRLKTRLDDQRWQSFLNYERAQTRIATLSDWFSQFGLGAQTGPNVSVIDLSMLSNEVLPYACAVIGRLLLEARERLPAASRYEHPWVLVLEEAHNYARPARADEDRGHKLARLAYERIAKEGRKFGLSLIVASQRPSEISPTIISQCANFISHRLQNPDDIDHFRRIIPMQARRLLDQVTILAAGEAIVFGSAFHIPTRVQFDPPDPGPYSQTAAPYYEWKRPQAPFPLASVIKAWGL